MCVCVGFLGLRSMKVLIKGWRIGGIEGVVVKMRMKFRWLRAVEQRVRP
jgi:hypothetical protein